MRATFEAVWRAIRQPRLVIVSACCVLILVHLMLPALPADSYILCLVGIAALTLAFPTLERLVQGSWLHRIKWGDKAVEFQRLEAEAAEVLKDATQEGVAARSGELRDTDDGSMEGTLEGREHTAPRAAHENVRSSFGDSLYKPESSDLSNDLDLVSRNFASYHFRVHRALESVESLLAAAYSELYSSEPSHSAIYLAAKLRNVGYLDERQFDLVRRFLVDCKDLEREFRGPDWNLASLAGAGEAVVATLRLLRLKLHTGGEMS